MAEQESILRIKIDSRNAEKNANSLNKELQSIEKNGDFASKSMDSMSVATRSLAGYMAGIVTVGAAINKMDMYTNLNNRLKLVTTNQTELNTALNDTFAIAQKSYQAWDSVVQVYQRFSDNAKTLGINMQQTAQLTETVSKAVAISGASTQAAEAALTQFGQALASGTLRGEELNSILEQTPALAKAIAQGMGITVGQLRSVAAEGKITGDVLVKALTKSKQSVDELFSRTDITIGQSITLLSNEVTKFTGEAGKASGAASFMADAIKTLSQNLDLIANIAIIGGVALLTKTIATQTATLYASIGATIKKREADAVAIQSQIQLAGIELQRTRQVQALALTELNLARQELNSATTRQARAAATMRLTQAEIAHNIAIKQTTASTAALNVVESQLNKTRSLGAAALGLVGGPIGAITLGVTALSAAYMLFSGSTKESTESLRENNESVSDAIAKYKELTLAKQQSQAVAEMEKLSELGDEYSDLSDKLNTATYAFSRNNDMTREQSIQVNALVAEYKKTNDLEQFSKKVNALTFISDDSKNKFNTLAGSVKDAGDKFRDQRKFIEQMNAVLNNTKSAGDNAAAGIRNTASALNEINTKLSGDVFAAKLQNAYEKQGKSAQSAARWTQIQLENAKKGFKGVTVEQKKMLDQLDAVDKQREARQKAQSDANKAQAKASKDASTQAKKDTKIAEDNAETRKQIAYSYSDEIKQIYLNLDRELADIEKSGAGEVYAQKARDRAKYEEEIYLRSLTEQINSFRWSEEEKLNYSIDTQKLIADESGKYNDDIKKIVMENLEEERAHELANIKLAKEQRIFQAEQAFMTESEIIRKRYALESQEISKMLDKKEAAALQEAKNKEFINLNTRLGGDMLSSVSRISDNFGMNQEQTLNTEYIKQNEEMNLRYAQQVEAARQNTAELLIIEQDFLEAKDRLNTEYAEKITTARQSDYENQLQYYGNMLSTVQSTFGNMTSMVKESQGETSSAYKAMFLAQQAMAVASALVSTHLAAAQVMADPTALTLAQKTTYANLIMGMGYANVGMIIGQTIAGFKTGGYTGNGGVSDVAGVVHGKEYVLNAEATKRVGVGTLNAINNGASFGGGITVNIVNNGTPQAYDVQQINENTVKIIATDIVNKEVTRQLSAPNSPISKGIKQNFNTSNRRG